VFVWALLFSFFAVPAQYQFRVLFWGVFGALVLRAIFIFAGVALIERFDWILYVFGAFLLFTAFRIARHSEVEVHPERNPVLKIVRRVIPSTPEYDGQKLFSRKSGRLLATPLLAVLVLVEATDVVFAVDSVPAILAVSREPFIVFASNAFAILGLRSLYFLLAGMANRFRYLNIGLGVILGFVGVKMLVAGVYHVPVAISLGVIAFVLAVTVLASLRAERRSPAGGKAAGDGASPGQAPHALAQDQPPRASAQGQVPHAPALRPSEAQPSAQGPGAAPATSGSTPGDGHLSSDGHRNGTGDGTPGHQDGGRGRSVAGPRSSPGGGEHPDR
jgi:tellurite resistance protein TerC